MNNCISRRRRVISLGILFLAALGGGCASTGSSSSNHPAPALDAPALRGLATFRGDGTPATFEEIVAAATATDVVILGENHGHPIGLPWAAMLFEEVLAGAPQAALSLEFFERDDQSRLDDYLKGVTDETAFLRRADRNKGNYPDGHRRMVEAAKAKGRPVVAANTTWEVIRFMRGKDFDALGTLTPEQQRLFRIPDAPPEGRYRADYDALMGPMVGTDRMSAAADKKGEADGKANAPAMTEAQKQARLDALFRTMQLWDWTMAESVARAVEAGNRPVVHVEGRFHSDFFGGTPQAVVRLRPGAKVLVVSVVDASSTALREEDRGRGGFVVYVGPSPEADATK